METFALANSNGIEVSVTNLGGIITSLRVPDRDGKLADVVLGMDSHEDYLDRSPYFGALIGRFANRIQRGRLILNGKEYKLAVNDGSNHLHGGLRGFDKVIWEVEPLKGRDSTGLLLHYLSKDGEEGYPGDLEVEVRYFLDEMDDLTIQYKAAGSKLTHLNLTNHSYFNLGGHDCGSVLDHEILINADFFTPTGETSIPTGEIRPVENSAFDFRTSRILGEALESDDEQIRMVGGFDHNFVLNKLPYDLSHAATVRHARSGRCLKVFTTEPGVQFYSGNYLDGIDGKNGARYYKQHGFCLETQHFPDSPNKSMFPSTSLAPGQTFLSQTIYRFEID